jgi:hypothetical protein
VEDGDIDAPPGPLGHVHRREIYAGISKRLASGRTTHWIEILLAEDVW